jgi:hypothetical protein
VFAAHHRSRPCCGTAGGAHRPRTPRTPRIQRLRLPVTGGCAGRTSGGARIQPERPPSARRQTAPHLPVDSRLAAAHAPPGEGHRAPQIIEMESLPVRAFVVASRWAPPQRANGETTALPPHRPAPAGSYLPPAPTARHLDHPETSPGTGGTTAGRRAASQVRIERPSVSHVARAQTQGPVVCGGFPRRHRFGRVRDQFRGTEYRSVPLQVHRTSLHFGLASLTELTGKPSRAFRG